ncbi:MAG: TIGR03086 family metal-binding protein [Acidimicrobiia bacterium]|nr:TIGR03086 family metal-binding protein [Acidimicrobiia bacterium]
MDTLAALEQTFARTEQLLSGTTAAQLGDPTPCKGWTVRELVEHLTAVVAGMGAAVSGSAPAAFAVEGDLGKGFAPIAAATLAAWRSPGALEATVDAGAGAMPGSVYLGINLLDTAGHAWDLAKATGQDTELPAGAAQVALECARQIVSDEIRPGRFDAAVAVGADASPTTQLAAFLGRQP